jgi:hypothetical protein
MAKKKRRDDASSAPASAAPAVVEPAAAGGAEVAVAGTDLFSVKQYVLLNVVFDAFCILQLVLCRVFIRETRGLYFFFGLLMIGFLLVSVFDYVYDRLATRPVATPKQ